MARINKVIYSNPVTVVIWDDGTKTKSRCDSQDTYDELTGFMLCVFINGLVMSALSVMLGIYYSNIGLSEFAIGNLLSIRTFGNSIGAFFAIFLVQTFGTKRSLYVSFSTMIISGMLFTNITFMPVMQIASFFFGVCQAIFAVVQAPFYKSHSDD